MCLEVKVKCNCGKEDVRINLKNNIMPEEVIERIYCPEESNSVEFNKNTMINDNGWIIQYNMEVAKFIGSKKLNIDPEKITPEFLFDEGYATWKEIFPGELELSKKERERLMDLAKKDKRKYFEEMKNWANSRMLKYKKEGWRKAQNV